MKKLYDNISRIYYSVKRELGYSKDDIIESAFSLIFMEKFSNRMIQLYCPTQENIKTAKSLNENKTMLYRGVHDISGREYIKCLKNRSFNFYRIGQYGIGSYFSSDKLTALFYAQGSQKGVLCATLDCEMDKTINCKTMFEQFEKFMKEVDSNYKNSEVGTFILANKYNSLFYTLISRANNYDVIDFHSTNGGKNYCILNPKSITILEK